MCVSDFYVIYPPSLLILRELFRLFLYDKELVKLLFIQLSLLLLFTLFLSLLVPNILTDTLFSHVPMPYDLITARRYSIDASGEYVTSKISRVKHFVSKM